MIENEQEEISEERKTQQKLMSHFEGYVIILDVMHM